MNTSIRPTILNSSSSSYLSSKPMSLNDIMQNFYTLIENLKVNHQNDIEVLNQRICELETENRQLHEYQYQQQRQQPHPHSIFDINYISDDAAKIQELENQLREERQKFALLQSAADQQCCENDELKMKQTLRTIINDSNKSGASNSNVDSSKIVELESKLKQIKDQINQFEQCHYESDEQIRLLKQLISTNDSEQINTITQSLTVKQADLHQQTDIVTNILNKQQEKILEKIANLFEKNFQTEFSKPITTTTTKKSKKKRL